MSVPIEYERFIFHAEYKDGKGHAYVYGDNLHDFLKIVLNSSMGYKYDFGNSMVFYLGVRVLRIQDMDPNKMYYWRTSYDTSYLSKGSEFTNPDFLIKYHVTEVIIIPVHVLSEDMAIVTIPIIDLATGKTNEYNISYYVGQIENMSEYDKNEMIEVGKVLMGRADYAKFITPENLDILVGDII